MVEKMKLKVNLVDKHHIFPLKAKYNPNTRLAEVKKGLRKKVVERFKIDPDHVYQKHRRFAKPQRVAYVDNASRESIKVETVKKIIEEGKEKEEKGEKEIEVKKSVKLHNDNEIDQKKRNILDLLVERNFWLSIMTKNKLALTTILIMLFAGMGLGHILEYLIQYMFS